MAPAAGVIRRYGDTLDRSSACYDTNKAVVVKITDACPCNFPVRASPAASLTKAMLHQCISSACRHHHHRHPSSTIHHHPSSSFISTDHHQLCKLTCIC
jgi:exopolyphosphatase/pppGpp-phosphohydrolase